jgi:hypothetical protein
VVGHQVLARRRHQRAQPAPSRPRSSSPPPSCRRDRSRRRSPGSTGTGTCSLDSARGDEGQVQARSIRP